MSFLLGVVHKGRLQGGGLAQMRTNGEGDWLHADVRNSLGLLHCLLCWRAVARRFLSPVQWRLWLY